MSPSHADELWPLFPLFFVGLWVVVCFFISQMGWRAFSNRYPMQSRPAGRAYLSPTIRFGNIFASYRNAAGVIFTDAGVYFYVMFLFRAFHPPFLVPWESVRSVQKKEGFFGRRYRLEIKDAAGEIHVLLPKRIEEDLTRYYKGTIDV
jgi:hypothetical protein